MWSVAENIGEVIPQLDISQGSFAGGDLVLYGSRNLSLAPAYEVNGDYFFSAAAILKIL